MTKHRHKYEIVGCKIKIKQSWLDAQQAQSNKKFEHYIPDPPDYEVIDARITPVHFNVFSPKTQPGWKGT